MTNDNYRILILKLDEFTRKYYKNLVIRGAINSFASFLVFFLLITAIEYVAHLGSIGRALLFFSFIIFNIINLSRLIIIPLLKLYRLGGVISHEKAAEIIGQHFKEIQDKLINILQLKKMVNTNSNLKELIEAGINQKINLLKPIPFQNAINLKENKKYLKYITPPLFILLLLLFISPSIITDSTTRIIKYNTAFIKPAPFEFQILNKNLNALQNDDYVLDVKITGNELPAEVYINVDNNMFSLSRKSPSQFQYTFKNLQKDVKFQLSAVGYSSGYHTLKVLPKPIILNFEVELNYPNYTNKKNETITNTGDILAPVGTEASWRFYTRDTRFVNIYYSDSLYRLNPSRSHFFSFKKLLNKNTSYSIYTENEFVDISDSIGFTINVIPDAYPTIEVEEFKDSVLDKNLFFEGSIKDDYGFRKLTFNHRIITEKDNKEQADFSHINIEIDSKTLQQTFYYHFNLNQININAGSSVEYFFEVWDNDAINGSKSSRTRTQIYKTLTDSEVQEKTDQQSEQLINKMQAVINDAKSIQRNIDELNRSILEKKQLNWQDKKNIENLLFRNRELQKNTDNIKKDFEQKESWEGQHKELNEEILRKQEELNKLLEELMTDEMKALMDELEKLMDKLDKDKIKDVLDKMKFNTEDVEKQLDRSLELFKQYEFEKKLSETIDRLEKLAEEQKSLSDKSSEKDSDNEELLKEQSQMNEEFEKIQKEIEDLHNKNQELERPNSFERTDKQQESIMQKMQESSNNLQKNNNNKASESQKNASEQMQELSDKLKEMEADMLQESLAEDADALRMILQNLLRSSFTQEDLMLELRKIRTNDPRYVALIQEQNKIKDDLKMIEDSLFALSKRQVQIQSFVNREIADINNNMEKAIEALVDRKTNEGASRQQYIMTHINNLALMLNESLENLNNQMAAQKSGNSNSKCNKPGGGEQSFQSLRQMQEALNKMLQDLKDGKEPQGKQGGQSLSEQFARMAAQQEALRNYLRSLADELKKQGQGSGNELNELQQKMEETETDIVNKIINNQTLKRQEEILTRLLEHERAERERELDDKRESQEVKNQKYGNPNEFFKYKRLKEKEEEMLKTVPPSFNIFYKNKVNEYFYNF